MEEIRKLLNQQSKAQKKAAERSQAQSLLQAALARDETLHDFTVGTAAINWGRTKNFAIGQTDRRFILIDLLPGQNRVFSIYHQLFVEAKSTNRFTNLNDELMLRTRQETIEFLIQHPLALEPLNASAVMLNSTELAAQIRDLMDLGMPRSAEALLREHAQKNSFFAISPQAIELQKTLREVKLTGLLATGFSLIAFVYFLVENLSGNFENISRLIILGAILFQIGLQKRSQKNSFWALVGMFCLDILVESVITRNLLRGLVWTSFLASLWLLLWPRGEYKRLLLSSLIFGIGFVGVIGFFSLGHWFIPVSMHNLVLAPGEHEYIDDFSLDRGWGVYPAHYTNEIQVVGGIMNVKLTTHITKTSDHAQFPVSIGNLSWLITAPPRFAAGEMAYSARIPVGLNKNNNRGYGTFCQYKSPLMNQDSGFAVVVYPNRSSYEYHFFESKRHRIISEEFPTQDLSGGDQWNQIRVVCGQGEMALWINGKQQTSYRDADLAPFNHVGTGLFVYGSAWEGPLYLEFDNLAMSTKPAEIGE